jgi:NAD(P)-dependent dehydrogenase (short-subunit alcohol dehydrogenase family)
MQVVRTTILNYSCLLAVSNLQLTAILIDGSRTIPFSEQAKMTMGINFFGTLELTRKMLPMLQAADTPIIVNVASQLGSLQSFDANSAQKHRFIDSRLTIEELEAICHEFVRDAVNSRALIANGWPKCYAPLYSMSKVAIIALTKVLARDYPDMMINCCCPG